MMNLIEKGAFWKKTGKSGVYLAGKDKEGNTLFIFPVKEKKNPSGPDYRMMGEDTEQEPKEPEPPKINENELPF